MRSKVCLIISVLLSVHSYSQKNSIKIQKPQTKTSPKKDTVKDKEHYFGTPLPEIGDIWQGYNNIEVGLKIGYIIDKKRTHNNISLILGGEFFKHNVTYASPFATLKIYFQFNKGLGLHISGGYWYTKYEGITDQRITPEIGIGFRWFSLSYGYNIPISGEQIPFITNNRIALRWIAF